MSGKQQCFKIFMFPWLGQGHISPFFELAKRLIAYTNFHVYLCSTSVNLEPLRKSIDHPLLEFVDFRLSNELPEIYHTTRNLPGHLIPVLKTAFDDSKENFRAVVKIVEPDIVIFDFVQPWAPQVATEEGISSVAFFPCGAACTSMFAHYAISPEVEFPFETLRFSETEWSRSEILYAIINDVASRERFMGSFRRSSASFVLMNSSDQIEAGYIGYLSELVQKDVVPVGFLVQDEPVHGSDDALFLNWLGKKNQKSVVFVSFGSEYFLSKKEMEEVALGLEISGLAFIWVVRFPAGEKVDLDEALPQGFRERVGDRGTIIEGWAPQAKILSHSSVGGLVSHCGWNSIIEAITCRVPVIAMPTGLERPITSRLLAELGIGVEVRRDGEEFTRGEIASKIRKVVVEEDGENMRRNVERLSSEVKRKRDAELDAAVKRLVQLAEG